MTYNAPGKHFRKGISHKEFFQLFPNDAAAEQWFVTQRWPEGIRCPHCGSDNVQTGAKHETMDYRCRKSKKKGGCDRFFSTKTGTVMEASNIGYQDWLFAMFLVATNLKGVSSMKLRRDLGVTQKTAWHLAHRIRQGWSSTKKQTFAGPVEVDETYMGGKRKNMSNAKRERLEGRGAIGKIAVVGAKDRETKKVVAEVVGDTTSRTLKGFVSRNTQPTAKVYTDNAPAYDSLPNRESVNHSIREFVKGEIHTNGIESFWSMLKRAHMGTFHHLSPWHLHRYVDEFAGRHNMREHDTLDQMHLVADGMVGKRLRYRELVA